MCFNALLCLGMHIATDPDISTHAMQHMIPLEDKKAPEYTKLQEICVCYRILITSPSSMMYLLFYVLLRASKRANRF